MRPLLKFDEHFGESLLHLTMSSIVKVFMFSNTCDRMIVQSEVYECHFSGFSFAHMLPAMEI